MISAASLSKFGFRLGRGGAHGARTMMLDELTILLDRVPENAEADAYRAEVVELNALGKPTQKSRALTYRHLSDLYALDPATPLFRVFRRLWGADPEARPVLALTLALARDGLLRSSQDFILSKREGETLTREDVEAFLASDDPDRFSPATLKSVAQNINGSWTQAGYLSGKVRKVRSRPKVTPSNISYGLFLTHLQGLSGQRLFTSPWMSLMCGSPDELEAMALSASHRGQIVFLNAGGVKEVRFPGFLTPDEELLLNG